MRLLIVEDEHAMRMALTDLLQAQGWRVRVARDGREGLRLALDETPDLVVLDVMLPGLDGFSLCRELRARGRAMPVLMLTARGQVGDRVTGLDAGADDYLPKPFAGEELLARVRALLRRVSREGEAPRQIQIGHVTVDFEALTAVRGDEVLAFTAREFAMLRLLVAEQGRPVSRERFLDVVWESNAAPTTRTVDNQVLSLRSKLEPDPARPRYLKTVHRVGYRLDLTKS
jgi:DNA-binding response OmpR family regulator